MGDKIKYSSTTVCHDEIIDRLCKFEVSKEVPTRKRKGGDLIIEGLANAAVPDRIGDIIKSDAWELDSFKDNPIIFFNHDRDIPIGKAIDVGAGEDGLRMKARISKSNNGPVPFIRDMIEEGILKTFSVGFDPHDSETKDAETGHNNIGRAELLEVSVVTLPMNQQSMFDVSSGEKSLNSSFKKLDTKSWKTKGYIGAVQDVLELKGAFAAAILQQRLQRLSQSLDLGKTAILNRVASLCDYTIDDLNKAVVGDLLPIPNDMLKAFSEIFMIEIEQLQAVNSNKLFGKDPDEEEEEEEEEDDEDKDEKEFPPKDDDDDEEEDEEDKKEADAEDEDDEEGDEDEDEDKADKDDMKDCVAQKLPKLLEDGMERDQAIARAISMCRQESGKSCEISPATLQGFIDLADNKQAVPEGEEPNPTIAIDDSKNDPTDFGNPHLDIAKSQMALTGSMVQLLKELVEGQRNLNDSINDILGAKTSESDEPQEESTSQESETEDNEIRQLQARLEKQANIFDDFECKLRDIRVFK